MVDHDGSYKRLFSHPRMVRDLLEGFVREDGLERLDYASLERVSCSYVASDLRKRASDMAWRLRWGESSMYIYLLLEFQSTVDPCMAIRVLTYVGLLYEDLIHAGQRCHHDGALPPVLPIVLYNGAARWNAAEELTPLMKQGPPALMVYRPNVRYLLIDEARYRDSELAPMRNLVAAVFRLENARTSVRIGQVLTTLIEWLKTPEENGLRQAFVVWVRRVIMAKVPEAPLDKINDLEEMRTMVVSLAEEWKREALREGLQEGRQIGHREGEVSFLARLLKKRFGELPDWVQARLEQAPAEQLERWGEKLLHADSLDTLFDGEHVAT